MAGYLLNAWFLIALSVPAGRHLSPSDSGWDNQALAWLAGSALWIAVTLVGWLARGRNAQPSRVPEISGDMTVTTLSRPAVLFAVIRAAAVGIAAALAFGLGLPNADWMPVATLVAMKGSLGQTTLAAEQRLLGTVLGALVAAAFLMGVDNIHALEVVIVVLAACAASLRAVNYTVYCTAVAAAVLIAMDLPHPTDLTAEFHRVLSTLAGVGIAVIVLILAGLLQKRATAKTHSGSAGTSP